MTSKGLYEGVLIEVDNPAASNILLEDFNHFANKAINQYVNKRYNIYDINQQTTDDLGILKSTAILPVEHVGRTYKGFTTLGADKMATYEAILPQDYLHLLNCECIYNIKKNYKGCYRSGTLWRAPATRLTADTYSQIIDNFWTKPTYRNPYYYIHNVNKVIESDDSIRTYTKLPTNPAIEDMVLPENTVTIVPRESKSEKTYSNLQIDYTKRQWSYVESSKSWNYNEDTGDWDSTGTPIELTIIHPIKIKNTGTEPNIINLNGFLKADEGFGRTIELSNGEQVSTVDRIGGLRYGNSVENRIEIRYGTDNSIFELDCIYIDYIKAPQHICLTQEQLDMTEDTSQVLEFPDYVCQEILNELVHIIMEKQQNQRLLTHPVVTLSIANPAQALAQQTAVTPTA